MTSHTDDGQPGQFVNVGMDDVVGVELGILTVFPSAKGPSFSRPSRSTTKTVTVKSTPANAGSKAQ